MSADGTAEPPPEDAAVSPEDAALPPVGPTGVSSDQPTPVAGADPARSLLARARDAARQAGHTRRAAGSPAPRRAARRDGGWSGARPDERDPQRLGSELERMLDERGWGRRVRISSVEARWPELVGAEVAAHCRPDRFVDGELHVVASSTAWATQVRLLAPKLAAAINTAVGESVVRSVVVRGPSGPSWRRGRLSVSDGRGPRDTYG